MTTPREQKEDVVAIVWKIEISLSSAKVQAVLILKSRIIMEFLWRENIIEGKKNEISSELFRSMSSVKKERESLILSINGT